MKFLENLAKNRAMKGTIKKFNLKDFIINDNKGKLFALNILKEKKLQKDFHLENCFIIENSNKYGIDLLAIKDNIIIAAFEVEMRSNIWKGDKDFPFKEIKCLERKEYQWRKSEEFLKKLPKEYIVSENLKTYYMQINNLGNRAVIINGQDIFKYPLKHWKTNFQNEYARAVLLNDCYLVRLEN